MKNMQSSTRPALVLMLLLPAVSAWTVEMPFTTRSSRSNTHPSAVTHLPLTRIYGNSQGGNEDDSSSSSSSGSQRHGNNNPIQQEQQQESSVDQQQWENDKNAAVVSNRTAYYEKQYRVARARAKIDSILTGPDAPIDLEHELKNVKSIAPPTAPASPADLLREERILQLQDQMNLAVKQQDYDTAASTQREIGQLHVDDCGAVLQLNAAYYKAFSKKDFEAMEAVWLQDNTATCIHPSQKALVGSKAVLQSWKRMFACSDGAFQKTWMEPHNIRITVKGATTAIITCDEHVYTRRFVRGQQRATELVNKLMATNIFCKAPNGKWFITHHHASWHPDSDAAQPALAARGKGGSVASGRGIISNGRDPSGLNDVDDDAVGAMDGILGINKFGPVLGNEGGDENDKSAKGNGLIMGSLSDIINSGLGDILSSSGESGMDNINPLSGGGKAFIRVSRIEPTGKGAISQSESDAFMDDLMGAYDEEDDDSDDDEEDDDSDDEDGDVRRRRGGSSFKWRDNQDRDDDDDEEEEKPPNKKTTKAQLRQACLAELRKLNDMGAISPRQKRVLVTDIISSTAKKESSMVEIAYQLLCDERVDDDENGNNEEEFADQCRVIATNLLE